MQEQLGHGIAHARSELLALLEGMPQEQRPKLARRLCLGSEGEMSALEAITSRPKLLECGGAHDQPCRHAED